MFEGFLLLGVVILISVLGNRLYEKTGIPESLFMIILGLIAGPITGLVPPESLNQIVNYIFTLSLIVIIVESGISTQIGQALDSMKHASLFTFMVLFMSVVVCGSILHLFFGWNIPSSVIMGVVCSGTSTLPVIYFTERLDLIEKVKNLLVFESIFNDITLLTAMTLLLQAFSLNISPLQTVLSLLEYVSEPFIYGTVAAVFWTYILLDHMKTSQLKYISTLAVVMILYAVTEAEKGSGVLAILIFSVILGNIHQIAESTGLFSNKVISFLNNLDEELWVIRGIQAEISFLAKNFFFFIMGILFNLRTLNQEVLIITLILIGTIFLSRLITVRFLGSIESRYLENILSIALMLPRGLTASIASYMPANNEAIIPYLKEVVLLMVIITNLATTMGFFLINKKEERKYIPQEIGEERIEVYQD
jgi:cell volume regulation protein A